MIDTPGATLTPILLLFFTYWFIDLREFGKLYLVLVLIAQTSVGIGLMISALATDITMAAILTAAFANTLFLFAGLYVNMKTAPKWLSWI